MKRLCSLLFIAIFAGTAAHAQSEVAPVPRIKPVTAAKSWTITYQYKGPNPYLTPPTPAEANFYQKMRDLHPRETVTKVGKSGNQRMQVEDFDDGTQTVSYIYNGYFLLKERKMTYIQVSKLSKVTNATVADDFPSLGWIAQAQYKGEQAFQGETCWMYYMPAGNDFTERTAYVDHTTGFPLAIIEEGLTINYSYSPLTQAIELPPEFQARWKKYIADHPTESNGG